MFLDGKTKEAGKTCLRQDTTSISYLSIYRCRACGSTKVRLIGKQVKCHYCGRVTDVPNSGKGIARDSENEE